MILTPREQEIIAGLRQGYSILEVEYRLGLPRNSLRAQITAAMLELPHSKRIDAVL